MNYPKGSEWRKWDFHVHTPASYGNHSLGIDWDAFVERLIDAAATHQISAFATADYFTIVGYRELLKYYNRDTHVISVKGKSAQLRIFPGIELRLNIFNATDESINLHVLFDPDCCSPDFIQQNFLEELSIVYRGTPATLKFQNLLAIGKSINDGTALNLGQDFTAVEQSLKDAYFRKALAAITLNQGNIQDALKAIGSIFERQKLPAKSALIAVVGKGHGGIDSLRWFEENKQFSRAGLIREHLAHQADIIFSNDPNDRAFYLGQRNDTPPEEVEARFNNRKPCVWGSDAHDLNKLFQPSNGNTHDYTWVKADLTFEGLKQIIYEPELRVRVQQDDPTEEETFAKIDALQVDFPVDLQIKDKDSTEATSFCINGKKEIQFSPNLTCVIGGRGSGKSTLVHILFNLVSNRDPDRLIRVNSPLFNLQLNAKDQLGKVRVLTKSDIPSSSEFFLQNEVEKFAKDIEEMSNLIKIRLYALSERDDGQQTLLEMQTGWRDVAKEVDVLIFAYDEITRIDQQIVTLRKQKDTLKKQTDVIRSTEYKTLQQEIQQIANAISAFESYQKEVQKVVEELSAFGKTVGRLNWKAYGGQTALQTLISDLSKHGAEIQQSYSGAKRTYEAAKYTASLNEKKVQIKTFLKAKGLSPENIGEVATATQKVSELEEQIKALQQEREPHRERYEQKGTVLQKYETAYSSYKQLFQSVAAKLQSDLQLLKFDERDAHIAFQFKINDEMLKERVAEFVKHNNTSKVTLRSDNIQSVLFGNGQIPLTDLIADKNKMIEAINSSEVAGAHTEIIAELISNTEFAERLHLRMQQYHYDIANIQVQTTLGEKALQSTSFGERCGIVIAIVLVAGTNPIIIDQPEDNLDGKYISLVLVPLIRSQKRKRQIILVTRDANIAIGGDSDLILILDKQDHGTALLPSTIENKEIRPKYIWILDGGETAFKNREAKYCIPKLI